MSEASAVVDHSDEVILPIIALQSGFNGAVINITKDLNLYVRTGGSDANNGYFDTDASAFKSGTRAYDEASRYTTSNGAKIIINLGPGIHSPIQAIGAISGIGTGAASAVVIFRGKGAALTSVIKNPAGTPSNGIFYSQGANIQVEQLKLGGNGLGNALVAMDDGIITLGEGIDFAQIQPSGGAHMYASSGGKIFNYADYTISGGATRHMASWGAGSTIEGGSNTVTITQPVDFTVAFANAANSGTIYNVDTDYVGRELVTGKRFEVYEFGYINTENSGLNYFPGTIDGTWESGGAYDIWGGANQGPPGVAGPMGPKSMSLQLPVAGDEVSMFYARAALTITQINAVVRGTTPGVTWQVLYAPARNTAGTAVLPATNTTSLANNTITTFTSPNVPANNWVWMKVTATSGVALELGLSLQF
jgi:hypothetical protein